MLREWELSTWNTFRDSVRIQIQDLVNTSQILSPLSHLDRAVTLVLVLFVYMLHVPTDVITSSLLILSP